MFWEGLGTPLLGCSSPAHLSLALGAQGLGWGGECARCPEGWAVVLGWTLALLLAS